MLLRLFKGTGPGVIFLIAVTYIAVWLSAFISPSAVSVSQFETGQMPLFELMTKATGKNIYIQSGISFSLVAIMAFLLVNFNTASFFINERTYMPALMFVLIGGLFPECQLLNPVLPASIFLMLAVVRIIESYRKPGIANNFFDAGILISTGSLFYANLIWFGLLVIIGIIVIRSVSLTEIMISVIGLLTPYLITFGIFYVTGKDLGAQWSIITDNLLFRTDGYFFTRLTIIAVIFTLIIIIVSMSYLFSHMSSKKIKSRKAFSLFIWVFLISVAVYFVLPSVSVEIIWIIAIPVSYFLTHYFVFIKKKIIPELFLSGLFLLILLIQIFYIRSAGASAFPGS
jgi:hypothetical protein